MSRDTKRNTLNLGSGKVVPNSSLWHLEMWEPVKIHCAKLNEKGNGRTTVKAKGYKYVMS